MTAAQHPGIGELTQLGRLGAEEGEPAKRDAAPTELELANQRAEKAEQGERDANTALRETVSRRPVPRAALNPAPTEPGEMPDAATDPEGFKTWATKARDYERWVGEEKARTREATARSTKILDDYLFDFPKLRSLRDPIFQCFRSAAIELNLETLPEDNTAEMSQLRTLADKKVKEIVAAAVAASDPPPKPKEEVVDEEAHRTDGLTTGSSSTTAGGPPPKEEDGVIIKPLDQVQRDRQAKSTFF
jgi:hypothetical protein